MEFRTVLAVEAEILATALTAIIPMIIIRQPKHTAASDRRRLLGFAATALALLLSTLIPFLAGCSAKQRNHAEQMQLQTIATEREAIDRALPAATPAQRVQLLQQRKLLAEEESAAAAAERASVREDQQQATYRRWQTWGTITIGLSFALAVTLRWMQIPAGFTSIGFAFGGWLLSSGTYPRTSAALCALAAAYYLLSEARTHGGLASGFAFFLKSPTPTPETVSTTPTQPANV